MTSSAIEIDDSLYSRQRYVLGDTAMHKLAASDVFLFGLSGVGVEIAKNLVLAGVKSITIHDISQCSEMDMSCQFYIRPEDIKLKKSKGRASLHRLAELNSYVNVYLHEEVVDECNLNFLSSYQCVVVTGCPLSFQMKVNEFCRQQLPQIKFIVADVYGLFCWTFCDYGDEFEVVDLDGEDSKDIFVGSITKANPGVVTTADSMMHGFQTGDVVTFQELSSMQALNGTSVVINVLSPFSFAIGDTSSDEFSTFNGRGIVKKLKTKSKFLFKSLKESIRIPDFITPDFGKINSPPTIFIGMLALHKFVDAHKALPRPWHKEDCKIFLSMAENECNSSGMLFGDEERGLLESMSFTSQGCFPPLCAFLGGVVAQEVLKALSCKFEPLRQWLLFDAVEVIQDLNGDYTNFQLLGDRYDALRVCIGEELCKKLRNSKLFMVGCGAIGCELLKNFALLGVGSENEGRIVITDNDLIEKSNLNRQFLFRSEHIQKPKSVTAANSILQINPNVNIMAQQHKVGWETEVNVYPDAFYSKIDLVINALDNIEARRYVDRRCVSNQKPLLESGTLSTKGHVQIIIPFLTESYNSQNDPNDDEDIPYCTLRSFPANIEHCIEWARDKFEKMFVHRIHVFNEFWTVNSLFKVHNLLVEGHYINNCNMATKMACSLPLTWQECVSLARVYFEKWFNFKAKDLLLAFPIGTAMEDGSPFWQLPKRPPSPITFDISNELHMSFIISCAKLMAVVCNVKTETGHETVLKTLSETTIPGHVPKNKRIETDENVPKPQKEDDTTDHGIQMILKRVDKISEKYNEDKKIPRLSPECFEKDDDTNSHIDFIASAANLRAEMYGIAAEERLKIKKIAGRIVPAIATTTAAVSALVAIEAVKVVKNSALQHYRNAFLNLARNIFVLSQPGPVKKTLMRSGVTFSLWDRWEIVGHPNMTLKCFLKELVLKYKEEPTFVVQGTRLVFSSDMFPIHRKRLGMKMTSLLKISPSKAYVDLVISFKMGMDAEGRTEDESGPEVRYYHGVQAERS